MSRSAESDVNLVPFRGRKGALRGPVKPLWAAHIIKLQALPGDIYYPPRFLSRPVICGAVVIPGDFF